MRMSSLSISLGGMHGAEQQLNTAAKRIATQGPSPEDSVSLTIARDNMGANVKTAETAVEMQKSLINMLA
jgi:hypothetical protein